MLYYENQLNLGNIYKECSEIFKEQKPQLLSILEKYLDLEKYIPFSFKKAFYADTGRPRGCSLYGYISALLLQKICNIPSDSLLILILNLSSEIRKFCGIDKVPDASKWTRFKQDFCDYLKDMFINLVDVTEPICQAIDPILANMDIYDTSSIESYVTENNPKYLNSTIQKIKNYYKFVKPEKDISESDIYKQAYCSLPKTASSDSSIRKMYSNGHFCYGRKFGIITNGLGIIRHIDFFDDDFKHRHQDFIFDDTDNPDFDKSLADNKSLKPIFSDFFNLHPNFKHDTFLGDSAFDAYDTYNFLLKENLDGNWICSCENPCTSAKRGRTTYTTPSKNFRLYPGTIRGTEEWLSIYKIRGVVEQTINHIKSNMGIAGRKTRNAKTTKADVFMAGIAQLFTVIIAFNMSKTECIRSIKKLAC